MALNNNCWTKDRGTEPELVCLELSGHKDSGYIRSGRYNLSVQHIFSSQPLRSMEYGVWSVMRISGLA